MLNDLLEQLNKVIVGAIFVLLALVLGFIYWVFPASTLIPIWVVCLVIICCVFICIVEYALLGCAKKDYKPYRLPEVKNLRIKAGNIIFLAESVDLLSVQTVVSVYVQDDDIELLVGLGYIETKNERGFLQIKLIRVYNTEILFEEFENNSSKLEKIKIKHSIPIETFPGEINEQ